MEIEFVTNAFGIRVRKCCASCAKKCFSRKQSLRQCALTNEDVNPSHVCDNWQMQVMLEKAGMKQGCIKRKDYLLYLADIREDEKLKGLLGTKVKPLSIAEIRAAFEKVNGSIYINF